LTAYGDMDMSRITEKPAGRKPITTRAIPLTRLEEVIDGVERAVKRDERVFWVCPLVEENEDLDLTAAEQRYDELKAHFGERVRLIHGKMKSAEKDEAIADFRSGKAHVLVATTVIEVGVDVPDATVIVIEHAERFGLAQLHQLRGRVGRGSNHRRACCSTKPHSAKPPAPASTACATPTTASSSPRKTCACAAPANC
jgi:ATP-dependent DNA helicase RecG